MTILSKYCGKHGVVQGSNVLMSGKQKKCKFCVHKKQANNRAFLSDNYIARLLELPVNEARKYGLIEIKRAAFILKRVVNDKKS